MSPSWGAWYAPTAVRTVLFIIIIIFVNDCPANMAAVTTHCYQQDPRVEVVNGSFHTHVCVGRLQPKVII